MDRSSSIYPSDQDVKSEEGESKSQPLVWRIGGDRDGTRPTHI